MLRAVESRGQQAQQKSGAPPAAALTSGRQIAQPENQLMRLLTASGNQGMLKLVSGGILQRKLTINQPGDAFEQEADRMADAVMRMPDRALTPESVEQGGVGSRLQRCTCGTSAAAGDECEGCKAMRLQRSPSSASGTTSAPPLVHDVLNSPGRPLDASTRNFMESRFGRDFANVRLHTDSMAGDSAAAVQALAYTVGNNIVLGTGQYSPETNHGKRLLAHELTHVVQQGGADSRSQMSPPIDEYNQGGAASGVLQRAGDPAAIPIGFACPTDLTPGRPTGTDLRFPIGDATITPAHTAQLTTFRTAWLAAGGTDDILVHGYASTIGTQDQNWTLSCDRAQAVQTELIRLGIPPVRISIVAHGESTDFGPSLAANQHAVVTSQASILPLPLIVGTLTPHDNFTGRSTTRFGVGEIIDLNFFSFPPHPAADFGGLQWFLVSGGGTLVTGAANDGTGTYTAPATASTVQLELRVASGATAGRVISTHVIAIVIPSAMRLKAVAGSFPNFGGWGNPPIAPGTWGAGFRGDPFIDPKDVSFQGVVFSEGTVAPVVTPPGSFLSVFGTHPAGPFGPGGPGNATTGTPLSPVQDGCWNWRAPAGTLFGLPSCGVSDFLWAIPWLFSVAGGPATPFAGGFTANHHVTSTLFCNATIEKATAGPFCRRINGTIC
jgi:outer membrane protein OmpA-like peptidoglycan-associated protein